MESAVIHPAQSQEEGRPFVIVGGPKREKEDDGFCMCKSPAKIRNLGNLGSSFVRLSSHPLYPLPPTSYSVVPLAWLRRRVVKRIDCIDELTSYELSKR